MLKQIKKDEFEKRFPEISTYGLENHSPVYLENGIVLIDTEWNGEVYAVKDQTGREVLYRPIQEPASYDDDGSPSQWETVGYKEVKV